MKFLKCIILVNSSNLCSVCVCVTGEAIKREKCSFFNIVQTGGGQPMFKNYVGNCRVFWRSFNNMKFA